MIWIIERKYKGKWCQMLSYGFYDDKTTVDSVVAKMSNRKDGSQFRAVGYRREE